MKVTVEEHKELEPDALIICCLKEDERILKLKSYIQKIDLKLNVVDQDSKILIYPNDIYYFESVDKKTFVYLENKVFECSLKLYEIEEKYKDLSFFRASKNTIVNTRYIRKIVPMLNRNLLVTLLNNEKIIISRRNVKEFNTLIGWE